MASEDLQGVDNRPGHSDLKEVEGSLSGRYTLEVDTSIGWDKDEHIGIPVGPSMGVAGAGE